MRLDDITAAPEIEATPLVPAEIRNIHLELLQSALIRSRPCSMTESCVLSFGEPDGYIPICLEAPSKNCADE